MAISGNDSRSENSHLGKTIRFNGTISGADDVVIDGEVEGTIQLGAHQVVVGPHGNVAADVQARELVVHGKLKGNAQARDRIEVSRTGSVLGDLAMARISIEDGAFMQGRIDIRAANAAVTAPAPAAPAPVEAATAAVGAPQQSSFLPPK